MANYTKSVNFTAKDVLPTGDPNKIVRGTELNTEFDNIQSAVNSKLDANNASLTGSASAVEIDITSLILDGVAITVTGAELNLLDGVTATTAEINYLDGVTSALQTQLDDKQDSGALPWADVTGTPTTLAGYGITDAATASGVIQTGDPLPWGDVTGTPTTLAGYGITDAATSAQGDLADTALQSGDNISDLTNDANYVAEGNTPSENDILIYNEVPPRWEALANLANRVTFTANGNIVATNVQDAIEELDDEKAPITTTVTLTGTQTLTNKTFTGMTETVNTLATSGSITLTDSLGGIKVLNANGNVTFSDGLNAGESLTLMVRQSTGTITWPTVEWLNNGNAAPTVVATLYTGVVLWKVGSVVYGAVIGTEA